MAKMEDIWIDFEQDPNNKLEGRAILSPSNSEYGIIITHPYHRLGGSMDNNVINAIMNHFNSVYPGKFNMVKFNFRGVGRSGGSGSWSSIDEIQDVRAACRFLMNKVTHSGRWCAAATQFSLNCFHDPCKG